MLVLEPDQERAGRPLNDAPASVGQFRSGRAFPFE
jgi:hypothetical protein